MDTDIKYITENYLEWKALCENAQISSGKLQEMIDMNLIPAPSYVIETDTTIKSPLGDSKRIKILEKYFPKNTVDLIEKNNNIKNSAEFKERIKKEFTEAFLSSTDNQYAYDNILTPQGTVDAAKLDEEFETEWDYYLKGIYGICTLNSTGEEIAKKEIAVKKLIDFIAKHESQSLHEDNKKALEILNDQYNEISNLFAPYQRASSSRGKYLDKFLRQNQLDSLIKNYE